MTVLVVQSTAGTSQLNGSAPDPTNVPGNNWYSSNPAAFVRKSGGGVFIPSSATSGVLSYNGGTARLKITFSNVVLTSGYIQLQLNADAQGSTPFASGTGYNVYIAGGSAVTIQKWSGSSAPTTIGTSSSALPSAPITISSMYVEHLASGTINARVTIAGTNYDSTATDGSPLTGTYAGLFTNNTFASGTPADSITIEDAGVAYTYARPSSDVTTQWTPSTGTDHYALIDETVANDADYIYATAGGQTDEVRLASMSAPQAGTDLLINYRVQGIVGSASVTLSLVCNTTVIATDTARTANGDYTLTVASGTWASVADWTNMRLRFVSA